MTRLAEGTGLGGGLRGRAATIGALAGLWVAHSAQRPSAGTFTGGTLRKSG